MKFNEYKWIQWTNTEINRNKREKEAQSSIDRQDCKSINKKNMYIVAVA